MDRRLMWIDSDGIGAIIILTTNQNRLIVPNILAIGLGLSLNTI